MQLVQTFRVRLRRVARLSGQVAELMDLLGLSFMAQLARVVMFAALLALFLLTLLVRATLGLTVVTVRFLLARLQVLARALAGTQLLLLVAAMLLPITGFEDSAIKSLNVVYS